MNEKRGSFFSTVILVTLVSILIVAVFTSPTYTEDTESNAWTDMFKASSPYRPQTLLPPFYKPEKTTKNSN